MDLLCESDHKPFNMEEHGMGEILNNDMFQSPDSMVSFDRLQHMFLNLNLKVTISVISYLDYCIKKHYFP